MGENYRLICNKVLFLILLNFATSNTATKVTQLTRT